ncbi:hypothetical protein DLW27_23365 [Escherichia coli]|nr:hypothetical protein [Escherichia coli]
MNQFLKRTFRILNKPSEGRKTFQPLGEPTRLSTSIFCENKDAHKSLDSPLVYVGTHNVYYVKYGGFALKFMSPSLSGTYR